jgi:hypothetical protein
MSVRRKREGERRIVGVLDPDAVARMTASEGWVSAGDDGHFLAFRGWEIDVVVVAEVDMEENENVELMVVWEGGPRRI